MSAEIIPINSSVLKTKRDYALAYASIGWHVFPLHWITAKGCSCGNAACNESNNAGKHPYGMIAKRGQDDATTDEDTIKKWWSMVPDANIGVFLSRSKLCAIDIDPRNGGYQTIESIEDKHGGVFSDVMQFTGGGGEHRVFSLPENLALPGTLGPGVDVKMNGYIVVEPSNHKSGASYEWEASSAPYEGNAPSPLPDWMRDLATQKQAPASAGQFKSRYVTEEQIEELRSALLFIDPDDRDTWIRTGTALKTIGSAGWDLFLEYAQRSDKFNLSDQRRVWHSFNPHSLSYETVFFMAQEKGWVNMPTRVTPIIDFQPFIKKKTNIETTRLPGVLGDIEDYFNATAKIPQPGFAQQCAIGIASVMLGRRFRTVFDDFTSLYFLNIAGSAKGKEHIKHTTENVLNACGMSALLAGDGYTSDSAVLSALEERPVHISVIDELGRYLAASLDQRNHIARGANTALMECIGRLHGEVRSKNYSTKGIRKDAASSIKHPAITIQSMTTPSTFYESLTVAMIKDGFFGRFIVHHSKMPRVAPRKVRRVDVSHSIIDWASSINERVDDKVNSFGNPGLIGDIQTLDVSHAAESVLTDFSNEMVSMMNEIEPLGIEAAIGRYGEFAGRLALIYALAKNPLAESVEIEDALQGVAYMRDRANEVIEEIKSNLSGSAYEKSKKEILEALRGSPDGATERDMHRQAPFSKFKDKDLAEILQSLIKSESIALVNTREGKPGKPRMAFVAVESSNCH